MGLIKQNVVSDIYLLNVDYDYVGVDEDSPEDFEFKIHDDYKIDGFNEDIVGITFTRKVYYDPEMFFNISVKLRLICLINKEEEKELNKANLEKELKEKEKSLLSPVVSRASLLIANITNTDDDLNVITPPFLQRDKGK